jgi:hypothetical protein
MNAQYLIRTPFQFREPQPSYRVLDLGFECGLELWLLPSKVNGSRYPKVIWGGSSKLEHVRWLRGSGKRGLILSYEASFY